MDDLIPETIWGLTETAIEKKITTGNIGCSFKKSLNFINYILFNQIS